jgi:hypothetical protein
VINDKKKVTIRGKNKVEALLSDPEWTKIPFEEQVKFTRSGSIYKHTSGQIFWYIYVGAGSLYSSLDEFHEFLITFNEQYKSGHILEGRFPYKQDFPTQVPGLIVSLTDLLPLPYADLDGTLASLGKMDVLLRKRSRKRDRSFVEAPLFPALLAYTGEVIRLGVGGEWAVELDRQDRVTWVPMIIDPYQKRHEFVINLYDTLYEGPISLEGVAGYFVRMFQLQQDQRSL